MKFWWCYFWAKIRGRGKEGRFSRTRGCAPLLKVGHESMSCHTGHRPSMEFLREMYHKHGCMPWMVTNNAVTFTRRRRNEQRH